MTEFMRDCQTKLQKHQKFNEVKTLPHDGDTSILFREKWVKTFAAVSEADILEAINKPLSQSFFKRWKFLQDSAPTGKARSTQTRLESNVPSFISAENRCALQYLANLKDMTAAYLLLKCHYK